MTTTKSFFNRSKFFSIYQSTLKSQIPVMVVFAIVFFMSITLPLLITLLDDGMPYYAHRSPLEIGVYMASEQSIVIYVFVTIMAVLLALFANSYMHSKRRVDLYHSIPVTRPTMMTANLAASMTTIFLPFVGVALMSMVLQFVFLLGGYSITVNYFWFFVQDLAGLILCAMICYLFVTFVAVNVGTYFDTFAISAVLGFSAMFVFVTSGAVWSELSYGASFQPGEYILLLSPFTFIFYKYAMIDFTMSGSEYFLPARIIPFYLVCLLLAVALYFAAAFLYRRRNSEIAERTQTGGVLQTIVKVVIAFAGSALLYMIFIEQALAARTMAVLFGAVLIGVVAELIMSRSVRHIGKNLKWLLGTGALCAIVIIGVSLDVTGFVSRVPKPETVESVKINYSGRFQTLTEDFYDNNKVLTDPESVAVVTAAHRLAVDNYAKGDYYNYGQFPYNSYLTLEYTLKNGGTLSRNYGRLSQSAYAILADLEDKDDFIVANNPLIWESRGSMPTVESVSLSSNLRNVSNRLILSEQNQERLIEAIREDMLDESLEEIQNPSRQALGYITVQYVVVLNNGIYQTYRSHVLVTEEYTQTIALLKELDAYDSLIGQAVTPDSVYILSISYHRGQDSTKVNTLTPSDGSEYIYHNVYDYMKGEKFTYGGMVMTKDPQQVSQIYDVSRNQMLINGGEGNEDAYYAVFCSNGSVIGHMYLRSEDLSADLQESMWKEQLTKDEVLIPEEAPDLDN